jgi:hypothetical protein
VSTMTEAKMPGPSGPRTEAYASGAAGGAPRSGESTAAARKDLARTIRALRERLLADLHDATESAYRLSVGAREAGLDAEGRVKRRRLEAWVEEQVRAQAGQGKQARLPEAFRREAEKQAAYTLLNRLVLLKLLEAPGPGGEALLQPAVLTGGWESRAYQDLRALAPGLVRGDETEGYALLLRLVFEELATELPGLFGPAGVAELVPVPPASLRHVVEALNAPELAACWGDDMTLGWVYQYWNDPEREALDAKLNAGGKVAPHEIASKTQMFTERYMVDWLLQNSLGPMWLATCQQHGWTPEVEADGTLAALEARRAEWRAKREAGEVGLTALMPLHSERERRWAYYVPQPIPADAVAKAPTSVQDLLLLDPAVGSGHFLVVALDLLFALYQEEARHRGEVGEARWSDAAIVERILGHNLHGIDLDPRAVQIAAAALWLKARQLAPEARPERLNLVASNLRLASLADDDPALVELRAEVERETGIPGALTDAVVHALHGADHLGSLLEVEGAVEDALDRHQDVLSRAKKEQGHLFDGFSRQRELIGRDEAQASLQARLEAFLARHTAGDDLGLRLRGEQLAAGVRFARMVQKGRYHLVVANPPYQGTSKLVDAKYVERRYPLGKADLYAAFLLRGLELVRPGGVSAMLTMRNWMFIKQYAGLRAHLLGSYDLRALGDFAVGAFDEVPNDVLTVTVSVFHAAAQRGEASVALQPTPPDDRSYDRARTSRKRAATRCQVGRHEFDPRTLTEVPGSPIVYWWSEEFRRRYAMTPKLQELAPIRQGVATADDVRFLRRWWEIALSPADVPRVFAPEVDRRLIYSMPWVPSVSGARGVVWIEDLRQVIRWWGNGCEIAHFSRGRYGRGASFYFRKGVAFTTIGSDFGGRLHRFPSVFTSTGCTVFSDGPESLLLSMNSREAKLIAGSFNPTVHFINWDIERLPVHPRPDASAIVGEIDQAFTTHEAHREPSVEFKHPGPSPWRHAQDWAQAAVDRPEGAPLPEYVEALDPEPPTDHLSYALGVALGRFSPDGLGILDPDKDDLGHALPAGILFLDTTLDPEDRDDGLGHPAAAPLFAAWAAHGPALGTKRSLREWLAVDLFKDVHKGMYENRPIHWPLSSAGKTFVAWVNIHRMGPSTLQLLLADHLQPTLRRLDGRLADLRAARDGADAKAAKQAEKRYPKLLKAQEELRDFIRDVEECADRGPPPTDPKCPPREQDARYAPDLDDGVMINSAALWPLLEPQWKDPKRWYKELALAEGRKDYDWSHLAMRYWPERVDAKCQEDPSLGVAHGCFWRYHPHRAWAWELRLQDEIGPDFKIQEAPYRPGGRDLGDGGDAPHRAAWLAEHPAEALDAVKQEALRRMGRGANRKAVPELRVLEPGLWSQHPDRAWALELEVSERQGVEFRLVSPDEPEARAAYAAAHPDEVKGRAALLAKLEPKLQGDLLEPEDADEVEPELEEDDA